MFAYGLMLLTALAVGAVVWWNLYNSRDRQMARQRKRELAGAQARRQLTSVTRDGPDVG